jgi:hypothetical protein
MIMLPAYLSPTAGVKKERKGLKQVAPTAKKHYMFKTGCYRNHGMLWSCYALLCSGHAMVFYLAVWVPSAT